MPPFFGHRVVTIRLAPVLPTNVAVIHFPDVRSATAASIDVINRGAGIRAFVFFCFSSNLWNDIDDDINNVFSCSQNV